MKTRFVGLPALFLIVLLYGCYDLEKFTTDSGANVSFSTDTVHFDTVFTTIGSSTLQFKVYNTNRDAIKTSVRLAKGDQSFFRLNVDGLSTDDYDDLEISGNDSAFIFVEVHVDPQNQNSPMVIVDSVVFTTNGNVSDVKLLAYGQDVHVFNDSVIGNSRWQADKPYLVFNSVLVDSLAKLTIDAGAKIHFHNNSSLLVKGTVVANGTLENPIVFQGDRLEDWYKDLPGQWGAVYKNDSVEYQLAGIHFLNGSHDNVLDYTIVKNGIKGIQVDNHTQSTKPTLTLSNSIVREMSIAGLYAQTSNILVYNSIFANCNYYAVALSLGGHYEFYHTTINNDPEWGGHSVESVVFNNYYVANKEAHVFDFYALFANSIIYGTNKQEFAIDTLGTGVVSFDYRFDHCLMKLEKSFNSADTNHFKEVIRHADSLPRFKSPAKFNYRLDTLSPAKDKGWPEYSRYIPLDLDGNDRLADGKPDLGAYERIE